MCLLSVIEEKEQVAPLKLAEVEVSGMQGDVVNLKVYKLTWLYIIDECGYKVQSW